MAKRNKNCLSRRVIIFIVCLVISFGTATIGSFLTTGNIKNGWYESIKPSIAPPNFVFPVVWNILFFLIALSLFFAWTSSKGIAKMRVALVFTINLLLNMSWSLIFFTLRSPLAAFIDIFLLWGSILAMILVLWKISRKAAILLMPYILWVSFAAVLNYFILRGI